MTVFKPTIWNKQPRKKKCIKVCKLLSIIQVKRRIQRVCATRPPMQKNLKLLTRELWCPATMLRQIRHYSAGIHQTEILDTKSKLRTQIDQYLSIAFVNLNQQEEVPTFYLDDRSVSGCSNQISLPGPRYYVHQSNMKSCVRYESKWILILTTQTYVYILLR